MSKKDKRNKENFYVEDFLAESEYDIGAYEMEKIKRKERRELKKRKDKNKRNRFLEEY